MSNTNPDISTIKSYTIQKLRTGAERDGRFESILAQLQSLWPNLAEGDTMSDAEVRQLLEGPVGYDAIEIFSEQELKILRKVASMVISIAVEHGNSKALGYMARHLHPVLAQDVRTAQIGWDLEEYMDWYFAEPTKSERQRLAQELLADWESIKI